MAKRKLITPLFLLSSFLLIGCSSDTIVARPTWIDEKIFATAGDKDNKFKNIYDAVKNLGDTNSSVLNNVMYKIAQDQLGTYDELAKWSDINEVNNDNPGFDNFVNNHKIYQSEEYGALKGQDSAVKFTTPEQLRAVSYNKVKDQYDQMIDDIYESLYNDIKGGSYSEDNVFSEKKFIMHLRKELYTTNTYYDIDTDTLKKDGDLEEGKHPELGFDLTNKVLANKTKKIPDTAKEDYYVDLTWKQYVDVDTDTTKKPSKFGFLHISTEFNITKSGKTEKVRIYDDYIARKILPELYKTYLTQTYVTQQRYSSLGRSYARKVNMVTVPISKGYEDKTLAMMKEFVDTYIGNKDDSGKEILKDLGMYDFEILSDALRGFVGTKPDDSVSFSLLDNHFDRIKVYDSTGKEVDLKWTSSITGIPTTGIPTYVYKGTKLGDLMTKLITCCDVTMDATTGKCIYTEKSNPTPAQETALNDIKKNGTYDLKTGLKIKEMEANATTFEKDGWFLKNGGLTDLDTTFRDRLFNISTSNDIDNSQKIAVDGYKDRDYIRYFGTTENRQAFLTTNSTASTKLSDLIILEGKSNYFIVGVDEAANSAKVSLAKNKGSYSRIKADATDPTVGVIEQNKLMKQIVKANSSSDTYKKNANEYYLMISNIVFYDQSVYDYFKSQFPDLFK